MQLMLIRHGETDWNSTGRYLGQRDVSLNQRGVDQARSLADRLQGFKPDYIYSSDLQRAVETACILKEASSLPLYQDKRLREFDFGYWEGKTYKELSQRDKKVSDDWFYEPDGVQVPGGESFNSFKDRVLSFSNDVLLKHQEKKVMVITHGGPIRVLMTHYLGMPVNYASRLQIKPAAINRIDFFGSTGFLQQVNA